ncbi:MAG: dihydroorotase [Cyanobium sp. PLM2.Bin73]|nr:MAG: dihydroorotase [Cyanobium sp. PLM2.Bin73]
MPPPLWLRQVQLLTAPGEPLQRQDALIDGEGRLQAWGEAAGRQAAALGSEPLAADGWLLAPTLVDPHSVLEQPFDGTAETLDSLSRSAAAGGYGTVALLPWARPWRDRPERLKGLAWPEPLRLLLWGSFSLEGSDAELAPHRDQLNAGAIGVAVGEQTPPLPLLERGLLLAELEDRPVLVPARSSALCAGGFVREGVETLRAGWPPDPLLSELLPLQSLLALAAARPDSRLTLMNLSTAAAVEQLRAQRPPLACTVNWWHLLADSGNLAPAQVGWRLLPSLGTPRDRRALRTAALEGLISAVAVHHLPLDAEEQLLPLDQRRPGVAGHGAPHGLVLPLLWQELVEGQGCPVERLWELLSWGGSAVLGLDPERLEAGSRRWLLFDPGRVWRWNAATSLSLAANQPRLGESIRGAVLATGLTEPASWALTAGC